VALAYLHDVASFEKAHNRIQLLDELPRTTPLANVLIDPAAPRVSCEPPER